MKIVSKRMPVAIVTLMTLEFLLGLLASLYQELPKGYANYGVYSHLVFIFLRVLIAVTLTVLATILLVKSARRRLSAQSVGSSIIGLAFIVSTVRISGIWPRIFSCSSGQRWRVALRVEVTVQHREHRWHRVYRSFGPF
jgi:hypothetical protein